jgi:hypothetical protein
MFNLEIGRFIAATNTSVAEDVPRVIADVAVVPQAVAGEVIDIRAAIVTVDKKPATRRKFGFLALKRRA